MSSDGLFAVVVFCYLAALLFSVTKLQFLALVCLLGGLVGNLFVAGCRYLQALPMMPMHLGVVVIPVVLGMILGWRRLVTKKPFGDRVSIIIQTVIVFLATAILLFPKDFYLPFIRSISLWAHLFFVLATVAKAGLIYSGIASLDYLLSNRESEKHKDAKTLAVQPAVISFALLTLAMFCGEIWSYCGWGTPVVWHDAAITTVIALWFYWVCLLHLLYLRGWTARKRAFFTAIGGLLAFVLTVHPDLGPFRLPVFFR